MLSHWQAAQTVDNPSSGKGDRTSDFSSGIKGSRRRSRFFLYRESVRDSSGRLHKTVPNDSFLGTDDLTTHRLLEEIQAKKKHMLKIA